MFVKIPNTRIVAVRAAVPSQEIKIEDELEYYGGSLKKAERAKNMIGTCCRRQAYPNQTASDLCFSAAEDLLENYPHLRENTDALIFVSQSPDYDFPATACILQNRLGLSRNCAAFDVNQGCAGYIYGLWLAASLLNSGCNNILLLAGDVPYRKRNPRNRIIAPIFGDGGSATYLCRDEAEKPLFFSIETDGSGYDYIIMPAGRGRLPFSEDFSQNKSFFTDIVDSHGLPWRLCDTYMNGKEVFGFTLSVVPEHIKEFIKKTEYNTDKIDYFILHQANRQIISEIAKKAGLPTDKTPSSSFSKFGNLSSASIPTALCDLLGNEVISRQTRMLLCGYGVGLTWGSCLWEFDRCDFGPVIDVVDPHFAGPEEQTNNWINFIERN